MATTLPNPELRKRHSLRLAEYDYTQPGGYFVTLCAHERECLFGEVVSGEVAPNRLGAIVAACWTQLPKHFPRVELDAWIVMPNHLHGVLILHDTDDLTEADASPSPGSTAAPRRDICRGEASAPRTNAASLTTTDPQTEAFPFEYGADASPSLGSTPNLPVAVPASKGEAFAQKPQGIPLIQTGEQSYGVSHTPGANASPLHSLHSLRPVGTASGSLAAIIQNLKSVSARRINQLRRTPGAPVWQRNYYEHIIRNQASLDEIREYIAQNPTHWGLEDEYVGRERTQGI